MGDASYHHLYYSAHADPVAELEALNKSSLKLDATVTSSNGAHHVVTDSRVEDEGYNPVPRKISPPPLLNDHQHQQPEIQQQKTHYNSNQQSCNINSQSPLLKPALKNGSSQYQLHNIHNSNNSKARHNTSCCCSCCCCTLVLLCVALGFFGGIFVSLIAHRNGYGHHLDRLFPSEHGLILRGDQSGVSPGDSEHSDANHKCTVRLNQQERSRHLENCDTCFKARLLNVSNAWYADCNGLYSLSNLTAVWDKKRVVYMRIHGGINPGDRRFIYWNSHFYGANFYGWSIGDSRSLFESGPFHAQGREGVREQPWLGSWADNVTVTMVECGHGSGRLRFDRRKMEELLHKNQLSEERKEAEEKEEAIVR